MQYWTSSTVYFTLPFRARCSCEVDPSHQKPHNLVFCYMFHTANRHNLNKMLIITMLDAILDLLHGLLHPTISREMQLWSRPKWPNLVFAYIFHSLTRSLTHSLPYSLARSLTHSLTYSLTHSITHLLTHLLTRSLTRSLTHSLAHLLAHSLTHSRTYSLPHAPPPAPPHLPSSSSSPSSLQPLIPPKFLYEPRHTCHL